MNLINLYKLHESADQKWVQTDEVYHLSVSARIPIPLRKGQHFTLRPSIPAIIEPNEDNSTPRISFCRVIEQCLEVLPGGIWKGEDFYIFKPVRPVQLLVTNMADEDEPNPEASRLHRSGAGGRKYYSEPWDELWSLKPVECAVIGIFEYSEDDNGFHEIESPTMTQTSPKKRLPGKLH